MMSQLFLFYSFLAKLTFQLRSQNETEEMMDDIMLPPATGSLAITRQLSDCASSLWIEQMYREQSDENVVEYDCIVAGSDLAPPRLFDRVQNTGSSHLAYSMPQMVYYNRLAVITLSISRGDEEAPIGLRGPFIMDTTSSSVVYQEDISRELLTSEGLFVTHEGTCFESRVEIRTTISNIWCGTRQQFVEIDKRNIAIHDSTRFIVSTLEQSCSCSSK